MPYLIANVDPQIHSIDAKLRKVISQMEDAKVVEEECITEQDVIDFAGNADAILTARAPITKKVINKLPKCKVIGRFGTGTDNVAEVFEKKEDLFETLSYSVLLIL